MTLAIKLKVPDMQVEKHTTLKIDDRNTKSKFSGSDRTPEIVLLPRLDSHRIRFRYSNGK